MRLSEHAETTLASVAGFSKQTSSVMEYSEGGGNNEGQRAHHYHTRRAQQRSSSYILPSESRQQPQQGHLPAQPIPPPQQQPWPSQQPPLNYSQQQQQAPPYSQQIYPQTSQDSNMSVSMMEHSSNPAYIAHPPGVAAQQQTYMTHGYPGTSPGYNQQYAQQLSYQQQFAMQQSMAMGAPPPQQPLMHHPMEQAHPHIQQQQALHQPYLQPKIGRLPADRPLIKLSVSLIDTYKHINTVYYEERDARRATRAKEKQKKGQGANNDGWDDEHYDYIITPGELFYGRYRIKERIGKGSFGQVVRAEDVEDHRDVAIKIIKSKKPFLLQAKTEIELLSRLNEKDASDDNNIGKRGSCSETIVLLVRLTLTDPPFS
eukprot:scaffold22680_cov107-Cylindrotheca_fusiformis.AAC.11